MKLHGPDGHLTGVVFEDGTVVRVPPPDAERLAAILVVGQPLYVARDSSVSAVGKVVAARDIGPSKTDIAKIDEPRLERWMHDVFGGDSTVTYSF